jgi:hypothetical protein
MNKEEIETGIAAGNLYPLHLQPQASGGKGGPIKEMPLVFREMFHRSLKKTLSNFQPPTPDWSIQVTDDGEPVPLKYQLHCFHVDSIAEYMVMCRVGTYDLDKKEILPDEQDKIIVFKFKNVDDLL